jgi:glutaryl-CoA dehydrogenase
MLPNEDQNAIAEMARQFAQERLKPFAEQWSREHRYPAEAIAEMAALGFFGMLVPEQWGGSDTGYLAYAMALEEIAAGDGACSTIMSVHNSVGCVPILRFGNDHQKRDFLGPLARGEQIGAFALTEPGVGSGAARGLTTTARRDGDTWVLNGEKKWIGNATFADLTVVWAVDEADRQVKGFVVEGGSPGFEAVKISDKIALRVVQNAHITLTDCRVPETNRLQAANSFADTAQVLRRTRLGVAWEAVGCAKGAYDIALAYAKEREQFGRPIGGFQLVQDMLVRMLGHITASQCMVFRLGMLADAGVLTEEQASLAKAYTTVAMRESVGLARELMGGNGILLDHHVGRFVADAEAIYSYEGTREINTLVVGRAITGLSAFV